MINSDSPKFVPANTNLLYEEVISSIFQAILDGQLKPGERLVEKTIAEEVGVSRSPVRQALQEMERQGIVISIPRKGAYVSSWTVEDVEDFARVRVELEGLAAEQAADRIKPKEIHLLRNLVEEMYQAAANQAVDREIDCDLKFHRQVVKSSRNNTLISIYGAIELRTHMYMIYEKYISPSIPERMKLTREHMQIVDALEDADSKLAKELIQNNVLKAVEALLGRMSKHPIDRTDEDIRPVFENFLFDSE
jgi:DNA-binding GntR family transcriptional regulator